MKEMKREKHASNSSHNSCKNLSEELRDYYEGRHRSHLRPHSLDGSLLVGLLWILKEVFSKKLLKEVFLRKLLKEAT